MLDFWDILLIIIAFVFLLIAISIVWLKMKYVKDLKKIKESYQKIFPDAEINLFDRDSLYQLEIIEQSKKTIVKVIMSHPEYELIITNTFKWAVNDNPKGWSRKTKPVFINDSAAFDQYSENNIEITKIVLLYPGIKKVIRYLNESDTVILKPEEKVRNIQFLSYDNLEKFL